MLYGVNKTFVYICFTCVKFILLTKDLKCQPDKIPEKC